MEPWPIGCTLMYREGAELRLKEDGTLNNSPGLRTKYI